MSTQKVLARVVWIDWRDRPNSKGPYRWFETQEGSKFYRISFKPDEYCFTSIYLVKKLNVVRAETWAYELYEVDRKDLMDARYANNWKWFHDREIVYEVKR